MGSPDRIDCRKRSSTVFLVLDDGKILGALVVVSEDGWYVDFPLKSKSEPTAQMAACNFSVIGPIVGRDFIVAERFAEGILHIPEDVLENMSCENVGYDSGRDGWYSAVRIKLKE